MTHPPCFGTEVGTETIEEMAKLKPDYAVMRGSSMRDAPGPQR